MKKGENMPKGRNSTKDNLLNPKYSNNQTISIHIIKIQNPFTLIREVPKTTPYQAIIPSKPSLHRASERITLLSLVLRCENAPFCSCSRS